ncbi:unnamed protein product [Alopecurus aequalis]
MVVSKVLDDDDLLAEILLRVAFPTTLVRAAAVCTRWLHHVSDGAFLRRFRKLHPPRLLGFYLDNVDDDAPGARRLPCFLPMLPQAPELAAVIRRATSTFDAYQSNKSSTHIIDCRNGSALVELREDGGGSTIGVHRLLCHEKDTAFVPPFPCHGLHQHDAALLKCKVLPKEEEEGLLSYLYVFIQPTMGSKPSVIIYMLQNGVWHMHHSLSTELLLNPWWRRKHVLVDNKIYMQVVRGSIIVLDLTASSVSSINLPQGVEHSSTNTILAQADDAASVYLIHVKKRLLRIWLHNGDGWVLVDTICLHEMCASLNMLHCGAFRRINQAGDNAEFVFLEMGQWLLFLDIRRRTLRKVYENPCTDSWSIMGDVYPFVMVWPPTFPALKHDPVRFAS